MLVNGTDADGNVLPIALSQLRGGWINDRVHLYIFLVLLPFFDLGGYPLIFESLAPIGPVAIVRY